MSTSTPIQVSAGVMIRDGKVVLFREDEAGPVAQEVSEDGEYGAWAKAVITALSGIRKAQDSRWQAAEAMYDAAHR